MPSLIMLFCINKSYRATMTDKEKYEAVRSSWKIDRKRASKARLALAVVRGRVIAVFAVDAWQPGRPKDLFMFVGHKAARSDRQKYMGLDVKDWFPRGAQWPFRYVREDDLTR